MTDEPRIAANGDDGLLQVAHIIGDGKPVELLRETRVRERAHRRPGAYAGTAMPRCTAGRAPMASYQRLTLGKSPSSVRCHSCRATQG